MDKFVLCGMLGLFFLLAGCVTGPPLAEKELQYQEVVEIDADQATIYNKSLQWMAEGFRSAQDVIQYKDEGEGVIIGKGSVAVTYTFAPYPTHFTLKIEAKDGRYRVTFFDIFFISKGAFGAELKTGITNQLQIDNFSKEAKKLSESLREYVTGDASGGTW